MAIIIIWTVKDTYRRLHEEKLASVKVDASFLLPNPSMHTASAPGTGAPAAARLH